MAQQAIEALTAPKLAAPRWEHAAAALLRWASAQVRLIACATPSNLSEQVDELARGLELGQPRSPRLRYTPLPLPEVVARLRRAGDELAGGDELALVYAGRAHELGLEAEMCAVVGSPRLAELAARRYAFQDRFDAAAEAVARRWLGERAPPTQPEATIVSDDASDPASLLCHMRAEVGRRRLAVRVLPTDGLSALAATGPGVVYVARGQRVSPTGAARTVLHEIEGHVLPRVRAAAARLAIFTLGTARGSDDQEGRALLLEQRASMLSGGRRRELGRRHLAALGMRQGADVVQTARMLMTEGDATPATAARIALRVHRSGGLGREIVYLPAMLRVQAAQQRDPAIDSVLRCGQVSVTAAAALAPWCAR